ncbi:MAG: ABC transporter permease [Planctomycetes bacterium]|nr:ABC transporter permease [Planctomycetota bacterium]MBI3846232.1 ABC transporter permease [Planctomycetota bacterium]
MERIGGVVLPVVGIAAFLLAWQGVVCATRPASVQRVTLAFSAARDGTASAVVLDARGDSLLCERLSLDSTATESEAARLRTWIGTYQPTLVGMPPSDAASGGLRSLADRARREFGGGMEEIEVASPPGDDPCLEATRRATFVQQARILRPAWLPGPLEAFRALAAMAQTGELLRHVVASVFRVATGFTLAVVLGIPLGLALGSFAWLNALANAVIQMLRPISPIAWLPVATLALGGGDLAAIFLIFLASFFPVTVSTAAAVATIDLKYRRSAMNFGVRGVDFARRVMVPATLPAILTSMRIGVGIAWLVVVAAEMLGVESGLGYLVLDARNQLRYDRVAAAMIVIGAIGFLIDFVVRRFERAELDRRGMRQR